MAWFCVTSTNDKLLIKHKNNLMDKEVNFKEAASANFFQVAPGVWGMKDLFVNIYMVLNPFDGTWVLIDTGVTASGSKIRRMAKQLFGDTSKPSFILLTHGHFDHVGAVSGLAEEWQVPVYAHFLELPYLTGKSAYPPADPTVGGGLMTLISFMYPNNPINIWNHINVLPEDGSVPGLPEWKYYHTPGHAPGHVSFFRESDGVLIAGDAFVTVKNESAIAVILQTKKLSGPPKYFTYDWPQSRQSLKILMKLEPEIVATGHGQPMEGKALRRDLHKLSEHFYEIAVPGNGRYVDEPAIADATGFIYVPSSTNYLRSAIVKVLAISTVVAVASVLISKKLQEKKRNRELLSYEIW